jgi:hypothetical protein
MKTTIAGALLIGALALSPNISWAEDTDAAIEQLITNSAHSPADHLALAKYYRGKAADARAAASSHQKMASSYGGVKMVQKTQMAAHCQKISEQNTAMAAEFDALAKLHDEDAKQP